MDETKPATPPSFNPTQSTNFSSPNQPAGSFPDFSSPSKPPLETSPQNPASSDPNIISPFSQSPPGAPPASQPPSYSNVSSSKFPFKKILLILGIFIFLVCLLFLLKTFLLKDKIKIPGFQSKAPKITLTYWGLFEPPAVFQQVIDDYQKTHPNVQINYVQENLKLYRERLQAALEREQGPDIFRIHQTWIPMFKDLLSPLPQSVYTSSSFEKTFYPSAKETLKFQNHYVALPLMVDGLALFYNEDLFKSRNLNPPTTWGELKKAACNLTVKDEKGKIRIAGVALGTTNNVDHWSDILGLMILQNGGNLANPSSCVVSTENQQTCLAKDALLFYTLFASNQACLEEGSSVGSVWSPLLPTSTYAFATGQVAMYFGPSWRVFDIKNLNEKLNFKIVPVPQLPGSKTTWSSYWVEAVSKSSPHPEEAWEFLAYLSSKEVLQKLFQTQSNLRLFGEPYPRVDMADLGKSHPLIGPFIEQAPFAKTWFLCSNTFDNGLNDKIIKYYEDAVNATNQGQDPFKALQTATQGITQILTQYGLAR